MFKLLYIIHKFYYIRYYIYIYTSLNFIFVSYCFVFIRIIFIIKIKCLLVSIFKYIFQLFQSNRLRLSIKRFIYLNVIKYNIPFKSFLISSMDLLI